jgi:hypothetical protein
LLSTALPEAELTVVSVSVLPLICPLIRLVRSTVLLCPTVSLPVAAVGPGSTVMLTLPVVRGWLSAGGDGIRTPGPPSEINRSRSLSGSELSLAVA